MLSKRVQSIGLSPTLRVSALAAELRAAGQDVLDFSAGQPDFPTPALAKQAAIDAIHADRTRYTANAGIVELRERIAQDLSRRYGLDYAADEILVSPGAKASLYFAFQSLVDPGDEVLLPSPYWVSYPEQIGLAGAIPRYIACEPQRGFKLDPAELERAITPRSRVLVLNYPSNPTGACYTAGELEPIAAICAAHDLWVLADEIYSRLIYDGLVFESIAALGQMRQRTVVINGMSKSHAMTGWRVGYAAAPKPVIAAMSRLQSHCTSNVTSISQWASLAALDTDEGELAARVTEFQRRRDVLLEGLAELGDVRCKRPEGAFYMLPDMREYCRRLPDGPRDGEQLARFLLERAGVAVVPGEAFGAPGHVRLSYAIAVERIREGVARLVEVLRGL